VAALVAVLAGAVAADAAPVRQVCGWRGDGSGRYPDATPPLEWSATRHVRWSAPVGGGHASPIVAGALVFVVAEPDRLLCLDRASGALRWTMTVRPSDLADADERAAAAAYEAPVGGAGMAAATPVTDGGRVYAVFANGIVRAAGFDGRTVWTAFIADAPSSAFGRSASPILVAGRLIVHMTGLHAFAPASGARLWVNAKAPSSYGTPIGMAVAGDDLIVTPAGDVVRADTGASVASDFGRCVNASPITADGVVHFVDRRSVGVRLSAAGRTAEVWSGEIASDVFASPVVHQDLVFTCTGQGELFAFATRGDAPGAVLAGRTLFAGGADAGEPVAYASLALAGRHLFITSTEGETVVLEATREAREVARNRLPGGSGSSPAFAGSDLLLRAGDRLYCLGE